MQHVAFTKRLSTLWLNLSLSAKGTAIVAVPVICTLCMLLLIADLQRKFETANGWVVHTEEVITESGGLLSSALSAEATARGYMITRDPAFLGLHENSRRALLLRFTKVLNLTGDNPSEQAHMRHAMRLVEEELSALDRQLAAARVEPISDIRPQVDASRHRVDTLKAEIEAFQAEEDRLLAVREQQSLHRRDRLRFALWGFCIAGAFAGVLASVLFANGFSRRLSRIADNAARFSRRESAGPVDGSSDAIGQLEETLIATTRTLLDREQLLVDSTAESQQAKEYAEEATRAKTEFVSTISHEIRSPMNAILGAAEMLAKTPLTPQQAEYSQILNRAGNTLLSVVNEVLDISKIEAGRLELECVPFDCAAVVKRVADMLSVSAAAKGLELRAQYTPGTPRRVMGDPNRLERILLNLGGNAIKFTSMGMVAIRVRSDALPDVLHFSVADTGIGIPPERQEAIFQKFTQADTSTTRRFGGTGLGLAISKHIVELMGGRIWVESKAGEGSTFHFTAEMRAAPAAAAAAAADGNPVCESVEAADDDGQTRRIAARILLAEDSTSSAALVKAYVAGTGCTLDCVVDGEAALARLTAPGGVYNLVLMDVQMPKLDGYDVTSRFREWERANGRPRTPIVALTAHAFQEDIDRAIKAGSDGHLTKPIRRETLLDAVELYQRGDDIPELRVSVPDFIRELAPEFLRRQRLGLFTAASALKSGDFEPVQTFAHNMKGCGRSFGFPRLTELGRDMERAAKDRDAQSLGHQMEDLREYLTAVDIA